MSKTLVGIVTFGNLKYTKIAIDSLMDSSATLVDLFVVVGKPGDKETVEYLEGRDIPHIIHDENYGFPYSLNDIYDFAWKYNDYDNLIIMGNDVYCYPYAIDSLIRQADETDYEVISALQYDVRDLYKEHPEIRDQISPNDYVINDLSSEIWRVFTEYSDVPNVADMQLYDIQNLCLYKKSVFDKIGYTDVNFYPAYFVDNDYARRIVKAGIKCCSLVNARFFHFWSRTIKEESGGSTSNYFSNNSRYYRDKWGGGFGAETKSPELLIDSREREIEMINRWRFNG